MFGCKWALRSLALLLQKVIKPERYRKIDTNYFKTDLNFLIRNSTFCRLVDFFPIFCYCDLKKGTTIISAQSTRYRRSLICSTKFLNSNKKKYISLKYIQNSDLISLKRADFDLFLLKSSSLHLICKSPWTCYFKSSKKCITNTSASGSDL